MEQLCDYKIAICGGSLASGFVWGCGGQAQVRSLGAENTTDHASLLRVLALSKMELASLKTPRERDRETVQNIAHRHKTPSKLLKC
eukprot:1962044-Amphidinium_carterae.1